MSGGPLAPPEPSASVAEDHLLGEIESSPAQATVPESPPATLRSRLLRPHTLISFLVAIAIIAFFARRLDINAGDVWRNIRHADLALYGLAALLYYATFLARAIRWRWMLSQAGLNEESGYPLPANRQMVEIFLLSWFVNCVVPAKLGDAYRCYLIRRQSGVPISRSLGTIFAERITDLVVLFVTMIVAGVFAFKGHLPSEATRTLVIGTALLGVAAVVVGGMWFGRYRIEARLPARIRSQFAQLHDAIFACLRNPWRPIGISIGIWLADGLRFYLVAASLHAGLSYPAASFVALMSALLTTLPITPAGLGVVEVAMISVLKLVDIGSSLAGSVALMDRLLTYWSLVFVGVMLYIRQFRAEVKARAKN